jgi:hypothetical protein
MNLEEEVVAVIDAMWSHDASGRGEKRREKEKKKEKRKGKGKGKEKPKPNLLFYLFLLLKYSSSVPVLVFSRKLCIHISDTCTHIRAS